MCRPLNFESVERKIAIDTLKYSEFAVSLKAITLPIKETLAAKK